jgi:hypothetical protein
MPQISTCPRCRLQVSLPEKLSPVAQVKCPLCSAEYALQDALNELPPMLIVLDPGPVESSVMSEACVGVGADGCPTGMLPEVEFPEEGVESDLAHFADDEDVESRVALGDEAPAEGGAVLGAAFDDRSAQEDEGGAGFDLDGRSEAASADRAATSGRRGQRRQGGIGEVIKAVLGAVIGLLIGYVILLWLDRDPMDLKPYFDAYLPWIVPK